MIVLIHTSKTMRPPVDNGAIPLSRPILLDQAVELAAYLKTLSASTIEQTMKMSSKLATTTKELIAGWSYDAQYLRPAIDSFLGDIYSGLRVADWTADDRSYANQHLRILSGLYGILKPLDGIYPYRLEMGYRLPDTKYANLYKYWNTSIFDTLAENETIIDLTAVEYGKTVTDFAESALIVTPRFLTISPKTGEPTFVIVHAKIARGAFAGWIIRNRIENRDDIRKFSDIGYEYDELQSTPEIPVFVCKEFKGIGLSVRLS